MSKFQIVIDCETETKDGAVYFMDARYKTREILLSVTNEVESALLHLALPGRPIKVTGSRIVKTAKEFEYTS